MPSPFAEVLRDLARALDELGAGYYLFGAQAALVHGSARLTADVDELDIEAIVVANPRLDVERVRDTLELLEAALGQSDLVPQFETILARLRRG
jgi:hypothetical protein